MIIKVIERCMHDNSKDKYTGKRTVIYEADGKDTLLSAFKEYEEHFDCDNIIECEDSFNCGCLDSYVEQVTEVKM